MYIHTLAQQAHIYNKVHNTMWYIMKYNRLTSHEKVKTSANRKDSYQPAHPDSLTRLVQSLFFSHTYIIYGLNFWLSSTKILQSYTKSKSLSVLICTWVLAIYTLQSTLVISTSVISNNRLSRRENLVPVLTQKSKIRVQHIVEKRRNCSWGAISPLFNNIFNIYFSLKESNYIVICEICLF